MQFILGVFVTSTVVLTILLVRLHNNFVGLTRDFRSLQTEFKNEMMGFGGQFNALYRKIATLPAPVQNVIHLGLREASVGVDLERIGLPIQPEDFHIKVEKLRKKLLNGLAIKEHPDAGVLAYCILKHAGLDEIMNIGSWRNAQGALTRLLLNEDDEATTRFLETLADSVCQASITKVA